MAQGAYRSSQTLFPIAPPPSGRQVQLIIVAVVTKIYIRDGVGDEGSKKVNDESSGNTDTLIPRKNYFYNKVSFERDVAATRVDKER